MNEVINLINLGDIDIKLNDTKKLNYKKALKLLNELIKENDKNEKYKSIVQLLTNKIK